MPKKKIQKKKPLTPSEMGKRSWEARMKKHGPKKLKELMKKASAKGNAKKLLKAK